MIFYPLGLPILSLLGIMCVFGRFEVNLPKNYYKIHQHLISKEPLESLKATGEPGLILFCCLSAAVVSHFYSSGCTGAEDGLASLKVASLKSYFLDCFLFVFLRLLGQIFARMKLNPWSTFRDEYTCTCFLGYIWFVYVYFFWESVGKFGWIGKQT